MAPRLRAEEVLDVDMVVAFEFTDVGESWTVHVRRGVAEIRPRPAEDPDLRVTTTALLWRRLAAGRATRAAALASGDLAIEGGVAAFARFVSWFK